MNYARTLLKTEGVFEALLLVSLIPSITNFSRVSIISLYLNSLNIISFKIFDFIIYSMLIGVIILKDIKGICIAIAYIVLSENMMLKKRAKVECLFLAFLYCHALYSSTFFWNEFAFGFSIYMILCFAELNHKSLIIVLYNFVYFGFMLFMLYRHFGYIIYITQEKFYMLISTTGAIVLGFSIILTLKTGLKIKNIITRKFFHLFAFVLFYYLVMFQNTFTKMAFVIVLFTLIHIEVMRKFCRIDIMVNLESMYFLFIDRRDSRELILSHIYLLVGCLWMLTEPDLNDIPAFRIMGVATLCVGDSFVS